MHCWGNHPVGNIDRGDYQVEIHLDIAKGGVDLGKGKVELHRVNLTTKTKTPESLLITGIMSKQLINDFYITLILNSARFFSRMRRQ